jgi:hypothetical protein
MVHGQWNTAAVRVKRWQEGGKWAAILAELQDPLVDRLIATYQPVARRKVVSTKRRGTRGATAVTPHTSRPEPALLPGAVHAVDTAVAPLDTDRSERIEAWQWTDGRLVCPPRPSRRRPSA